MKRWGMILFVFLIAVNGYAADYIHDDYTETNRHAVHVRGLLTYGAHTNTFHVRTALLRYNYTTEHFQFFATLRGYKDTHMPAEDYSLPLNNLDLYDFGARYTFLNHGFVTFSGAAVYRKNTETYLFMPHYVMPDNPGEFDSPSVYVTQYLNAAGIRAGFYSDNLLIAYSQGDWRHSIPMAGLVQYRFGNHSLRALFQSRNKDPETYSLNGYIYDWQLCYSGYAPVKIGTVKWLAEGTSYSDGSWGIRAEEALLLNDSRVLIGLRQIASLTDTETDFLFEASAEYIFDSQTSIGVFGSSDGRIYFGTGIDF